MVQVVKTTSDSATYVVLRPICLAGERKERGDEVELTKVLGAELANAGKVAPAPVVEAAAVAATPAVKTASKAAPQVKGNKAAE